MGIDLWAHGYQIDSSSGKQQSPIFANSDMWEEQESGNVHSYQSITLALHVDCPKETTCTSYYFLSAKQLSNTLSNPTAAIGEAKPKPML